MPVKNNKKQNGFSPEELAFSERREQILHGNWVMSLPSGLSQDQLAQLRELVSVDSGAGQIVASAHADQERQIRRSKITLLKKENYKWLYDLAWEIARQANTTYKFRIAGIREQIQLSVYDESEQGFYNWHADTSIRYMNRKISISIPLNSPTEYQGGQLEFMTGLEGIPAPQAKGKAVVFPSFVSHRVTPVTKGCRYSLVIWVGGPLWS